MKNLDAFKQHGDIIWNIANLLRGPYRPPQYRRVMIPLTVLRRLDCVLEATKDAVIKYHKRLKEQTDKDGKPKYDTETIEKMVFHKFDLAFFNTSEFTFQTLLGDPDKLVANLVNYMAGFSSRARKIIEKFKFEEEIATLDEANRLFDVVKQVAAVDLHPDTIPNIAMGYLFEDLVRRFNEQANEEAGDHFTPREVIKLMVNLLFTHDDLVYRKAKLIKIYDPTCGTGGMLSESEKVIIDPDTGLNPSADVRLFGQEYNPESFAICGSDLMIKGEDVKNIVFGDTLGTGKPKDGFADGDGHPDEHFHFMLANPPFGVEWKPEKDFVTKEHDTFGFKGRFGPGLPRINDGALLFLLHMISKMQPEGDMLYVGEGDPIRPRLESHYAQKDFWTRAIGFTTTTAGQLNKAHVQFLESRLIALARAAKRLPLDNANQPAEPSLSEADRADMEVFLGHMLGMLPVLGVHAFEQAPKAPAAKAGPVLTCKGKGVQATGYEASQGFVVRAGSQAVAEAVPSMAQHVRGMFDVRQELIGNGVLAMQGGLYLFTQDYSFSSPSTAAAVVLGRSANGRVEWKAADGRTLKELQEAEASA
ncbi:DUF4357 domain-containing protein [Rhodoferax sp. GW822-FHT02A01]|uniref:DUF4357 domain-containing protein n=1 Tax=Rhodoferax sp. GW822-FHT02A01 TaxID=3141537 RepID=UPI00315C69CD